MAHESAGLRAPAWHARLSPACGRLELAEKASNYLNILRIGKSSRVRPSPAPTVLDAIQVEERCRAKPEKTFQLRTILLKMSRVIGILLQAVAVRLRAHVV